MRFLHPWMTSTADTFTHGWGTSINWLHHRIYIIQLSLLSVCLVRSMRHFFEIIDGLGCSNVERVPSLHIQLRKTINKSTLALSCLHSPLTTPHFWKQDQAQASWPVVLSSYSASKSLSKMFPSLLFWIQNLHVRCQFASLFSKDFKNRIHLVITMLLIFLKNFCDLDLFICSKSSRNFENKDHEFKLDLSTEILWVACKAHSVRLNLLPFCHLHFSNITSFLTAIPLRIKHNVTIMIFCSFIGQFNHTSTINLFESLKFLLSFDNFFSQNKTLCFGFDKN